ncbi:MAG: VWA domain-containing protein [Acidobacteriota bacterium]
MSRAFVFVVFALGAVVLGARQAPEFHGGTNTVSIFATVLDENARLVTNLKQADFDVFDNGVKQPVTVFANDLQPITIVVMLDRSGSMKPHFERVREAADVFVDNMLPADRARIGSFSDHIAIDPETFTSDRDQLRRILRENLLPPGVTPLWNAANLAMDALRREQGRRVILVFTDGKDTPAVGPNVDFRAVRDRSQIDDVMVYAIGFAEECPDDVESQKPRAPLGGRGGPVLFQRMPGGGGGRGGFPGGSGGRGRPGSPFPPGPSIPGMPPIIPPIGPGGGFWTSAPPCVESGPDPDLRELAAVGGGGYFELRSTADLRTTFARVADELHHQYLLAFNASRQDHALHRLEVRVRQPRMTVRARRNYVAD